MVEGGDRVIAIDVEADVVVIDVEASFLPVEENMHAVRWSAVIPLVGGFIGERWDSKEKKHIYCSVALSVSEREQDLGLTNQNYETASTTEEKILDWAWW
eukprot:TRINITY_DN4390_c1_g2_i1.p2 TRINITY_DN4390_c1_g2~~TRINITY_DN4390_c1_g2_i1.p2  ORF type:complete len:100 (-),score=25.27 TRINITY_DN4390_c1_g2_i1:358-657(-)